MHPRAGVSCKVYLFYIYIPLGLPVTGDVPPEHTRGDIPGRAGTFPKKVGGIFSRVLYPPRTAAAGDIPDAARGCPRRSAARGYTGNTREDIFPTPAGG